MYLIIEENIITKDKELQIANDLQEVYEKLDYIPEVSTAKIYEYKEFIDENTKVLFESINLKK